MSESQPPVPAASNGRTAGGKFGQGNRFGVGQGNPMLKRLHEMRRVALEAVGEDDLREIIAMLVRRAKGEDLVAAKILLEQVIGRPMQPIRIEEVDSVHPLIDPDRQRRFMDDPEYRARVMALEEYERTIGEVPGSAALQRAEDELGAWRQQMIARIAAAPGDGPPTG